MIASVAFALYFVVDMLITTVTGIFYLPALTEGIEGLRVLKRCFKKLTSQYIMGTKEKRYGFNSITYHYLSGIY